MYRNFLLPDGTIVKTRVSAEATLEWFEARQRGDLDSYPDRPPDIDTPTNRAWIEDKPLDDEMLNEVIQGWPLASIAVGPIKFTISSIDGTDHGYAVAWIVDGRVMPSLGGRHEEIVVGEVILDAYIEEHFRDRPDVTGMDLLVTGPVDFQELLDELEAVKEARASDSNWNQ
jgi:hypothetical protein